MYVADTHAIVRYWFKSGSSLGKDAEKLFKKAEAGQTVIYVPTAVLWELSGLAQRGRIRFLQPFEHWCRSLDNQPGYSIISLDWLDIKEARHLPFSDPMDCFIAGTAIHLDAPLITRDQEITDSNLLHTIW